MTTVWTRPIWKEIEEIHERLSLLLEIIQKHSERLDALEAFASDQTELP